MITNERAVGNIWVVDVSGRLTMSEGRGLVKAAVDRLLARGSVHVALNLENLSYIDSACLGELIQSHAALCRQGSRLKLVKVPEHLRELLRIAGLDGVFECFDGEAEAVRSFGA